MMSWARMGEALRHRHDEREGGGHAHPEHEHPKHEHPKHEHPKHEHPKHEQFGAPPQREQTQGPTRLVVDPEAHRTPLGEGAGRGKLIYLDAQSGLAGDMLVAALVDLGVPFAVVRDAIAQLRLAGVELELHAVLVGALGASKFLVRVGGDQLQRNYAQIRTLLAKSELAIGVRERALGIFARLAAAEAQVHRVSLDEVHFHEVGAADALADIVGAAAALEYLGTELLVGPLPLGRGWVDCQHGRLPLPAPATLLCLAGLATVDAGIEAELVTPTGAAIVGHSAQRSDWPAVVPLRVGYGSGSRTLPDRPNVLRAVLGERVTSSNDAAEGAVGEGHRSCASHVLVETNLDDETGELLGHVIDALLQSGALDAWATPIVMKKGRPAWTLAALGRSAHAGLLADVMLRETSAIGVRFGSVGRSELPRQSVEIETRYGRVPVKLSGEAGTAFRHAKPEYGVCRQLAERAGVPVREVMDAALSVARALL